MAKALVMHKFADEGASLVAADAALFDAAYAERYPPAGQKTMQALQKGHPGAFKTETSFNERARGMYVSVGNGSFGNDGCYWRTDRTPRLAFYGDDKFPLSDATLDRIVDLALQGKRFSEDVHAAYRKALTALSRFSTGKKLSEEWPEAMPIIGKLIPEDDRTVPVLQTASLNEDFGLPPSERLAA
jgi:hypothetical protein